MNFVSYRSIENHYRQKHIAACQELGLQHWVAVEKCHGSSMAIWITCNEIKYATRNRFLERGDSFFRCWEAIDKYEHAFREIRDNDLKQGETYILYAELHGEGVQSYDYSKPAQDLMFFDVAHLEDGVPTYWSWEMVRMYLGGFLPLPTAPVLCEGTLQECLQYDVERLSTLDNKTIMEGAIIRPALVGGPLIKHKSQAFAETCRIPKARTQVVESNSDVAAQLETYITKARFESVISKMGVVTRQDFGAILGLMVQDILLDYQGDTGVDAKGLCGDGWKATQKVLINTLRENLQQWL